LIAFCQNSKPAISVITEIELLSWKTPTDEDLKILHDFVADAFVFELEKETKLKAADLRKTYRIKLPDAIIAATALVYDITLITYNARDFDFIPLLKIIDPYMV
jgi:predicted nucleic acid-binding protein